MGWWGHGGQRYPKLPKDAVWGAGAGDQLLLVVPSLNLIMVRNGETLTPGPAEPLIRDDDVFANSVGPQSGGLWSAGDSKIVAPDARVLAVANNRDEMLILARLDLSQAGRKYAREALQQPKFLRAHWRALLAACRRQLVRG